jgi:hypothetical protein
MVLLLGGHMTKTISVITSAAIVLAFTSVFAQAPAPVPAPGQEPQTTTPAPAPVPAPEAPKGPEQKKTKAEGKGKGKGKGKGHGKGHDKKGGLDRADEAAGEHGKQGRDQARSNH